MSRTSWWLGLVIIMFGGCLIGTLLQTHMGFGDWVVYTLSVVLLFAGSDIMDGKYSHSKKR